MLALGELVGETLIDLNLGNDPLPNWANGVCASAVPALPPGAGWIVGAGLLVVGVIACLRFAGGASRALR